MPRRHAVLALVIAICWGGELHRHRHRPRVVPLLFVAPRFGLTAFAAIVFVPRPDVRWPPAIAVGLVICVRQFGLLFVA
jgi:hypothetical protein